MSRVDASYKDKFHALTSKTFREQATWFLNGFWADVEKEAESVWKQVHLAQTIDHMHKETGNELDEFQAHRFLEQLGETLTVKDMRQKLRDIDIDFNQRMALIEYLIFKHKKTVKQVCDAPQGGETKELERAQQLVAEAEKALELVQKKLEEEKKALAAAREAEEAANKAEYEQKTALAELKRQEDAVKSQLAGLEQKMNDPSGTTVTKGKAKQEYEALKGEDPLPLRRAKITQEATVRKFERARKFAQEQRKKAEDSTDAVEAAKADASKRLDEALAFLEAEKKKPGARYGDLWWLSRELEEKKKYMPLSKGGVARK